MRQVQTYLATLHELYLSVGEIVALAHCVRQQLQGQADQLLAQLRGRPVVHQDETGWREDGQNGYVWVTARAGPAALRYYEYSASRSHHVAQRLSGGALPRRTGQRLLRRLQPDSWPTPTLLVASAA